MAELTDAFEALTVSTETAGVWTRWLATGDPVGVPDELAELELVRVNGEVVTTPPLPAGPVTIVARRRFAHPDGPRWDHSVGEVGGLPAYAQQLTSPRDPARGTVAVATGGKLLVWLNIDGGGDPPAPMGRIYLELLQAEAADLRR